MNKRQRRLVLAHEMIHVKQYAKGELKVLGDKKVMWKGRSYRNYYTGAKHQLSPWEREAYQTDNLIAKICAEQPDKLLLVKNLVLDSKGISPEKAWW